MVSIVCGTIIFPSKFFCSTDSRVIWQVCPIFSSRLNLAIKTSILSSIFLSSKKEGSFLPISYSYLKSKFESHPNTVDNNNAAKRYFFIKFILKC